MDGDCVDNDTSEQSASMNFAAMACRRKERIFFLLLRVFLIYYSLLFFLLELLQSAIHYMIAS
jgi:hypothetical protein